MSELAQDPVHRKVSEIPFLSSSSRSGALSCSACHCHINNNNSHNGSSRALNDYYEVGTVSGDADN